MTLDGTLNLSTLVTVVGLAVGAVIWLVRLEGRVNATALKADAMSSLAQLHASQLADYKVHIAETYVTKQGMQEQTKQIMDAIKDVAGRVDNLGSRLDSIADRKER